MRLPSLAAEPRFPSLAIACLVLAGCGSDASGDGATEGDARSTAAAEAEAASASQDPGSFELEIQGEDARTISGDAVFYPFETAWGATLMRIILYDYEDEDNYAYLHLQHNADEPPPVGSQPVSAVGQQGLWFGMMGFDEGRMWVISPGAEGTADITSSSRDRIEGSFRIEDPEGPTVVTGTFDARRADVEDLPEAVR